MERKDLKGLVSAPAPNTQCWPSGLVEKLQSISVVSSDHTSSSKELRSQHDFGVPEFQNASQTLWDTGKLSEPIPDGFYFFTPVSCAYLNSNMTINLSNFNYQLSLLVKENYSNFTSLLSNST